jgi:hypothetical protein
VIIEFQNNQDDFREMTDGIAAVRAPVNGPVQIFILIAVFGSYYVITRMLWQKAGDADGHMASVNMWIAILAFGFTWLGISLPASFRSRRFPWLTGRQFISVGSMIVLIASLIFQHWMYRQQNPHASSELNWQTLLPHSIWLVLLFYVSSVAAFNQSKRLARHWEARQDLHRHQTVEITAEGVNFSDTVTSRKYQWAAFIKHQETKHLFLLFTSENAAVMIPKRAFESSGDLTAVHNLLNLIPKTQFRGFPVNMSTVDMVIAAQRADGLVVAESV